jgi:cytoskeleton protein RodZ
MGERKKLRFGIPKKESSEDLSAPETDDESAKKQPISHKKSASDKTNKNEETHVEELESPPENVTDIGAFLQGVRQRQKVDLRDVAAALNIRLVHLQALEDGRFSDLPRAPYLTGFVNGYAGFLKLDQQAVVAKFRSQLEGLCEKVELTFPVAPVETPIPTRIMILASILLAVVAYGSWYLFSKEPSLDHDIIYSDKFGSTHVTEDKDSVLESASDLQSEETGGAEMDSVVLSTSGEMASEEMENSEEATLPLQRESPVFGQKEATLPSQRESLVFGQKFGEVRTVIHATADSWIQVHNAAGDQLISRVLHPGDSYRVPEQDGLTLRTGNAGALQFLVDGSLAPSIGPLGAVRRDVLLDPYSLLGGNDILQ